MFSVLLYEDNFHKFFVYFVTYYSVKDMPTTVVAIFFSQYVTGFSTDILSLNGHLRIQSIRSWDCVTF